MISSSILVILLGAVFIMAEEIDREKIVEQCANENGLKPEDLDKWMNNQQNPTDQILCFMKCCHERDGSLKEDGKWNIDLLDEHLKGFNLVNDSLKVEIKNCFNNLPPIKSCTDMKAANKCIPEIKFRNCTAEYSLTEKDFEDYDKDPKNPSERMLCYFKCYSETGNMLYPDGTLNKKFLDELIDGAKDLKEEEKIETVKCIAGMSPVETCLDFKIFVQCMNHLKLF
ncbi:hypothetical protein HHI36_022198 [Cryptolaemus montrouzieri]|uniref:Uncharacterized protein n=1 Tax=Cryptolaemus montrouzieri TaxID=559131 RepID=A0ABD2MZH8_9CUCU